jgi:hypothetical protein
MPLTPLSFTLHVVLNDVLAILLVYSPNLRLPSMLIFSMDV